MLPAAMLLMIVSGCTSERSGKAVCDGTGPARSALAAALVMDGGPHSLVAGRTLIARLDAGCND